MSSPQETTSPPPVVDLAAGKIHLLPPRLQATLNPIQAKMRSSFGVIVYLLFGFFSVTIPVIGIPPILFLLERVGLLPHWVLRRFFDLCTANWITIMTVSDAVIPSLGWSCRPHPWGLVFMSYIYTAGVVLNEIHDCRTLRFVL